MTHGASLPGAMPGITVRAPIPTLARCAPLLRDDNEGRAPTLAPAVLLKDDEGGVAAVLREDQARTRRGPGEKGVTHRAPRTRHAPRTSLRSTSRDPRTRTRSTPARCRR